MVKNNKFDKMTVSKFKKGQNIRVITVANKPEISRKTLVFYLGLTLL